MLYAVFIDASFQLPGIYLRRGWTLLAYALVSFMMGELCALRVMVPLLGIEVMHSMDAVDVPLLLMLCMSLVLRGLEMFSWLFPLDHLGEGITLASILAKHEESYKESLTALEASEKKNTIEISQLKEEIKKLQEKFEQEPQEWRSRRKFLASEAGKAFIAEVAEKVVIVYKDSTAFEEATMQQAMTVYNDIVHECRRQLCELGHMPKKGVMLIDPHIPEVEVDAN
ncbi:hypothetical protein Pfo_003595 [Paulownia fortunei]|nr:hypothetical protein Pfo_003595 [Paulownia fortunei]